MTKNELLERYTLDMQLRGMSPRSVKVYLGASKLFLERYSQSIEALGEAEYRDYLFQLLKEGKLSKTTINLYNSALRFLFEITLEKDINYKRTARFRTQHKLPSVLSQKEVRQFFSVIDCEKYRAVFYNVYGSGLRASEICRLRVQDVDSENMRLFVFQGKGGKDRYTILSQSGLAALRQYWRAEKPVSEAGYLFPGQNEDGHLGVSGVEIAFRKYYKLSGIKTPATVHTLRHCFATHLLEAGTDVLCIKNLLGHSTFSSTNVYLHMANTGIYKTQSPMDSVLAQGL